MWREVNISMLSDFLLRGIHSPLGKYTEVFVYPVWMIYQYVSTTAQDKKRGCANKYFSPQKHTVRQFQ